ncbi:bacillithiol biosynthesis cysteine-adding enzyme BshC [Bacillus sp. DJP31]|uniref:bacillithiol biosynthesis cysteine-adding enzyme BshC n=1 Tax=Bacillus sp. DJP31 TaxID=3409789 RepID=UPI003BB5156F
MDVCEHTIPLTNKLMADYMESNPHTSSFFHYTPYEMSSYDARIEELNTYDFPREALVQYLEAFNQKIDADEKTLHNIQRLGDSTSVVVIGGQQAGLLTGPIYTINKIITIIQQAKQMEERLNRPVLPVFWIAGEDHDFAEVNHTFIEKNGQIRKHSVGQKWPNKYSVSDVEIDKTACIKWIEKLFIHFGETAFTNNIMEKLSGCLDISTTYVDFFARILFLLFKDTGLILIDSGDKDLRRIEVPYFQRQIQLNAEIDEALNRQQAKLVEYNQDKMIDTDFGTAHLFYHVNGERILLQREQRDGIVYFEGKQKGFSFTEYDLLNLVQSNPECFSNNVVTRPIMQDFLFPTLSFIAGPGEIAYWAELKEVFEVYDRKMPPVFPRLVTTIIEGPVRRDIQHLNISIDEILQKGVSGRKEEYLELLKDSNITDEIQAMKNGLNTHYEVLKQSAIGIHDSLSHVVTKNEIIIRDQLDYLEKEFYKQIQRKNKVTIQRYDKIQNSIKPDGQPQERMLNIFYFVNVYGFSIITRILEETSSSEYTHKILHV